MPIDLDGTVASELERHLEPDETLLWAGKPRQGILLRASDIVLVPFSIFWGGFVIFWTVTASKAGGLFGLFGVPFVLFGLYLTVGRFLVDAKLRSNTFYGLTDRRVVIISGWNARTTTSLSLKTLHEVSVTERPDRSGTIFFGRPQPYAAWQSGMSWPGAGQTQTPSFDMVPDAKRIHDRILDLR